MLSTQEGLMYISVCMSSTKLVKLTSQLMTNASIEFVFSDIIFTNTYAGHWSINQHDIICNYSVIIG
jgi:hypothetical protein